MLTHIFSHTSHILPYVPCNPSTKKPVYSFMELTGKKKTGGELYFQKRLSGSEFECFLNVKECSTRYMTGVKNVLTEVYLEVCF